MIGIIGVLVALLLPAIQYAREAARRATCANNLKQISLAVVQYSDAHDDMLPGLWHNFRGTDGSPAFAEGGSPSQSFGWRVTVLPYIEQQNMFDQIDFNRGAMQQQSSVRETVIELFQCPSTDGYPRMVHSRPDASDGRLGGAYDYNINHGWVPARSPNNVRTAAFTGMPSAWLLDDGRDRLPNWMRAYGRIREGDGCPMRMHNGPAQMRWVTDGLTNTAMLHEQAFQPNLIDRRGRGGQDVWLGGMVGFGWANPPVSNVRGSGKINRNNNLSRFSFHPGA